MDVEDRGRVFFKVRSKALICLRGLLRCSQSSVDESGVNGVVKSHSCNLGSLLSVGEGSEHLHVDVVSGAVSNFDLEVEVGASNDLGGEANELEGSELLSSLSLDVFFNGNDDRYVFVFRLFHLGVTTAHHL